MVDAIEYCHHIVETRRWRNSPSSRALVGNSEYQSFFLNPLAEGSPDDDQQPIAYAGASVAANDGNVSHNPLAEEYDNISSPPDSPARPAALASAFECAWAGVAPCPDKPCVQGTSLYDKPSTPSSPVPHLSTFMSTPEPPMALCLRHPLDDGVHILNALSAEVYDSDVAMRFFPTEPVAPCTPPLAVREAAIAATPEPLLPSPTGHSQDGAAPACRTGSLFSGHAGEKPLTLNVRRCQSLAAAYRHAASLQPADGFIEECVSPPPPPPPSPTSLLVAVRRLTSTFTAARERVALAVHTYVLDPTRRDSPPAPSAAANCGPSTWTVADDDDADITVQDSACDITDLASARSALRQMGVARAASASASWSRPTALTLSPTVCRTAASFTSSTAQESKPGIRQLCGGQFLRIAVLSDAVERDGDVDGGTHCGGDPASGHLVTGLAAVNRAPPRAQLDGDGDTDEDTDDSDEDIGYEGGESSVTSGGISEYTAAFGEGLEASLWSLDGWLEPESWEPLRKKYGCVRQAA